MSPGARAAIAGALTLATWLFGGYSFGGWPQLFPLEHILTLAGGLRGDWYTSHAAPHWVFDHVLALVPQRSLEGIFVELWVVGVVLFWSAFVAVAADLGIPAGGVLAAGLIGARTAFPGLGATSLLTPYLYPSSLACAGWLIALRYAFLGRAIPAGLSTGAAMLIHPQAGLLALATTAPVVARVAGRGGAARYAAVALVTGGFALARMIVDLGLRQPIAARERFDLLAVVRLPHHLIYRAFRPEEYVMVGLWALVLVGALARYRATDGTGAGRPAGWTVLLDAFVLLSLAGAIASSLGWPLALVELQTARLSAWIPLLGLLAAAAILTRERPLVGTLVLLAVPTLAEALWPVLGTTLERLGIGALPRHALQAPVLMAFVLATPVPAARAAGRRDVTPPGRLRVAGAAAAAAALIALGFVASGWRHPPRTIVDPDWRGIAAEGERLSQPTDVFLTPPDLDGFRFYSHRPIVVDFGEVAHDDLAGWRERMDAVTGQSGALAPGLGTDAAARVARIASAYDRVAPSAPELVRRYGVRFMVARRAALPAPPVWAEPVASNATYVLLKVRSWIIE